MCFLLKLFYYIIPAAVCMRNKAGRAIFDTVFGKGKIAAAVIFRIKRAIAENTVECFRSMLMAREKFTFLIGEKLIMLHVGYSRPLY